MSEFVTAADVNPTALGRFLRANFSREKAEFLSQHGDWWHRGQNNRWAMEMDGDVIAYSAVIPTKMQVGGETTDAVWWVDLVVDERCRGRGLETLFDKKVRCVAPLIVGFPNACAADIHRHHGWGVREDLEVRLLPLKPLKIADLKSVGGFRGATLRLGGILTGPIAAGLRRRLNSYTSRFSSILEKPDAKTMAQVFWDHRNREQFSTFRDSAYLQWRYLEAPYRDELVFISGEAGKSSQAILVLRIVENHPYTVARVLDIFGDTDNSTLVEDMVRFATQRALDWGAIQVTALASDIRQKRVLRGAGFIIASKARLCWTTSNTRQFHRVETLTSNLSLGDSDNDEP